tara:strand:- start:12144 stop:12341 length:198 start_codon:yes stop_codon:yes gene_type:complete
MKRQLWGWWFSVGPAVVASAYGRKFAGQMPRDRVVSKSDGSFAQIHGVPVMPWKAVNVPADLAKI